ncbi:unannotated protein [freshwater metagenome]|uniref:Unannotated protein n=1 Tax=freshwater metagenome TaxID=449393 RepID=A0A6J7EIK3_9ZZZZ|nr:twin-arginine translocase TatA/TatE family subunit [Actinomycetota bacterium]
MPIGVPELLIVLVILLLIFGPKRLPGLGRQLGGGLREFKDSVTGKGGVDDEDPPALAAKHEDGPPAAAPAGAAEPEPAAGERPADS